MTNDKKVLQKSYIKSGLAMAFIWDVHVIQQPIPISFVEQVCPFFYHSVKKNNIREKSFIKDEWHGFTEAQTWFWSRHHRVQIRRAA